MALALASLSFWWLFASRSEDIVFDGRRRRVEIQRFRLQKPIGGALLIPFARIESLESEEKHHDVWSQINERAMQPEKRQWGYEVWMTYRAGGRTKRKRIAFSGFGDLPVGERRAAENLAQTINELLVEGHARVLLNE